MFKHCRRVWKKAIEDLDAMSIRGPQAARMSKINLNQLKELQRELYKKMMHDTKSRVADGQTIDEALTGVFETVDAAKEIGFGIGDFVHEKEPYIRAMIAIKMDQQVPEGDMSEECRQETIDDAFYAVGEALSNMSKSLEDLPVLLEAIIEGIHFEERYKSKYKSNNNYEPDDDDDNYESNTLGDF